MIEVKSIKLTVPVSADALPRDFAPEGQPQPDVEVRFTSPDGGAVSAVFKGKNYRKALRDAPPGSLAIVQGRLTAGGILADAGLTVQPPRTDAGATR